VSYARKSTHRPARKPGRHDSVTRRLFNLAALVARVNAGRLTAASYLAELGADGDTIRRYAATLGKKIKAAYEAKRGTQPERTALALVGHHLTRCFAYDAGDVEILRCATAGYDRVSHLLNGAS